MSLPADTSVEALSLQNDGKILVGGRFLNYNGVQRRSVARLHGDPGVPELPVLALERLGKGVARLTFSTQPGRRYSIESAVDLRVWGEITNFFASSWLTQTAVPAAPTTAQCFYRARLLP